MNQPSLDVGIDGCRAGWIAVALQPGEQWDIRLYEHLDPVWEAYRDARTVLIDMPIGLLSGSCAEDGRRCDREARLRLKPHRASSVFPAPIREVLEAADYEEAAAWSRKLCSRGLSKQSWNLVPKIRQADALVRRDAQAAVRLTESHPELVFAALFGGPMAHGKKTQHGFEERLRHLSGVYPPAEAVVSCGLERFPRKSVARDDIVDALALAVAGRVAQGKLQTVPEEAQFDSLGIPMRIAFADQAK
ncbi:hypothetical protein SK3146_01810 [Paenibacillus konkukensis]|uniref:DUF429 domain-containing protein n=1 Tax=Paenibacillus konkukensis TaxID=2020716 RepID=A0ABY4RJM4_9BACL|nr:DUF429 domain-containing protein [Paenibacillus konkukensis]UQZ82651.1 hypothetical protein SK3146_01810 [Paenibacillus konkukensis]